MRHTTTRSMTAVLTALVLVAPFGPGSAAAAGPPLPVRPGSDVLARDSWIVTLVDAANPAAEAAGLAQRAGGRVGLVYEHALTGFQFHGSATAAASLAQSPLVRSVEADRAVYLTEEFLPYGVMRIDGYRIDPPPGAYQEGYRGAGVRIGILDTGIDLSHPDVAAQIDLSLGKNCVGPGPPQDGAGHGTHVAGSVAAPLNGVGVVGVAAESTLVPIKVFDDAGNSSEALVLCGIEHLIALMTDGDPTNDITVANMSFGDERVAGTCVTDPLHEAICRGSAAGIIFVAAAGNDAANASTFVPAAYPEVIAVSALADFDGEPGGAAGCGFEVIPGSFECDDTFAFFSNFGAVIDVMAPGVEVYSTWTGGAYAYSSGTSMAAPHVAGVIALMKAVDPAITPAEAAALLNQSGECPNQAWADADGPPGCVGQGLWTDDPDGTAEPLVNALRAAKAAAGLLQPGATFVPLAPARLLDTRVGNGLAGPFSAGVPRTFQVSGRGGVPADAVAVTGNLTVTEQSQVGFVYLGPEPVASPTSSTLNFPLADNRANGVTVALSATGSLSATYAAVGGGSTHLVFDVTGYFRE
jgi:subtilisin family serine protease